MHLYFEVLPEGDAFNNFNNFSKGPLDLYLYLTQEVSTGIQYYYCNTVWQIMEMKRDQQSHGLLIVRILWDGSPAARKSSPVAGNIFIWRRVWRHTEAGCTRNRTPEGQQRG